MAFSTPIIDLFKKTKYLDEANQIPNNLDTRIRLTMQDLQEYKYTNQVIPFYQSQTLGINPFKLLVYNFGVETLFYLPNRFRYTVLTESLRIDLSSGQNALLGTMKQMFNLNDTLAGIREFSIANFMRCY